MSENFSVKNNENDELTSTNEPNDYKKLIIRLQEISATIFSLRNII